MLGEYQPNEYIKALAHQDTTKRLTSISSTNTFLGQCLPQPYWECTNLIDAILILK